MHRGMGCLTMPDVLAVDCLITASDAIYYITSVTYVREEEQLPNVLLFCYLHAHSPPSHLYPPSPNPFLSVVCTSPVNWVYKGIQFRNVSQKALFLI